MKKISMIELSRRAMGAREMKRLLVATFVVVDVMVRLQPKLMLMLTTKGTNHLMVPSL